MKTGRYFVGIDGGGTYTIGVAADEQGHILARASSESINYYAIGQDRARKNFQMLLADLREQLKASRFDVVYIGSSALDREATLQEITNFGRAPSGIDNLYMHSDVYTALMGLTLGSPGVLVISGTGSIAGSLDEQGCFQTAGGWGYLLGDEGSAYDIALTGIKAAIKAYDHTGPPTCLLDAVQEYFQTVHLKDLVPRFYETGVERDCLAGFARQVDACAQAKDPAAICILQGAANQLCSLALSLLKDYPQLDPLVGLYGGVLINSLLTRDCFMERIHSYLPAARVVVPAYPPEIGAIYLCFNKSLLPFDAQIRHNIETTYSEMVKGVG